MRSSFRRINGPSASCRSAAGDTWSFSASGQWTNGWITCGPDGYRNFLMDALQIEPRAKSERWFRLMGELEGRPGPPFPIGAGCTHRFAHGGELVVFANDSANGYGNNHGEVTLKAERGGLAPAPPCLCRLDRRLVPLCRRGLEPGDVITTGTPPGVGLGKKPPHLPICR